MFQPGQRACAACKGGSGAPIPQCAIPGHAIAWQVLCTGPPMLVRAQPVDNSNTQQCTHVHGRSTTEVKQNAHSRTLSWYEMSLSHEPNDSHRRSVCAAGLSVMVERVPCGCSALPPPPPIDERLPALLPTDMRARSTRPGSCECACSGAALPAHGKALNSEGHLGAS